MFLNRGRHPKTPLTVKQPDKSALNRLAVDFADQMHALTQSVACLLLSKGKSVTIVTIAMTPADLTSISLKRKRKRKVYAFQRS